MNEARAFSVSQRAGLCYEMGLPCQFMPGNAQVQEQKTVTAFPASANRRHLAVLAIQFRKRHQGDRVLELVPLQLVSLGVAFVRIIAARMRARACSVTAASPKRPAGCAANPIAVDHIGVERSAADEWMRLFGCIRHAGHIWRSTLQEWSAARLPLDRPVTHSKLDMGRTKSGCSSKRAVER